MRLAIAGLVVGMLPVAAMAEHRDYDRPVYREYRSERYNSPPVQVDDRGDGRHYLDHHVDYDRYGHEYHSHHIHHYDD